MISIEIAEKLANVIFKPGPVTKDDIVKKWQEAGLVELDLKQQILNMTEKCKNHCDLATKQLSELIIKYFEEQDV
jgi:hypothetical protein